MDRNIFMASAAATSFARILAMSEESFAELLKDQDESFHWFEGVHEPAAPKDDLHYEVGAQLLADFVRNHPTAPVEALFRMAHGQGLHFDPPDSWADQPFERRVAFSVFATMIGLLDSEAGIEGERQALRRRLAASAAPVLASALSADPRDTIFEQHPDPLETNPHMTLKRIDDAKAVTKAPAAPKAKPGKGKSRK